MFIRASDFDPTMTQNEVDKIVNELALNPYEFSSIACLDGRLYGVTTTCQNCDLNVNYCLRSEVARKLYQTQQMLEAEIGYRVSEQYVSEKLPISSNGKLVLNNKNVQKVNVECGYTVPSGYKNVAVSPYMQQNISVQTINGNCVATFSANLVQNPNKAIIRTNTGKVYNQDNPSGYPKRNGANWEVVIDGIPSPCGLSTTFNVQHCELIRLQVNKPACTGKLYPVYPDTRQIIPTYRIDETSTTITFWFHAWVLARPEFMDDNIDFGAAEFYKLYDTIDIMCFSDLAKDAKITVMESKDCKWEFNNATETPSITILDKEKGIVYVDLNLYKCDTCPYSLLSCIQKYPVYIEIFYKVTPKVMQHPLQITAIKDAIAWYTAAELPLDTCDCKITEGFINRAQTFFSKQQINPFTGGVISNFSYGDMYGRVRYKELVKSIYKYPKVSVL